jgi:hypothetical protein
MVWIDRVERQGPVRGVLRSASMSFRTRRRWLVGAALCLAGCLSPTLPLPPPTDPMASGEDADGNVTLSGDVAPESEVFALNQRTSVISGQLTHSGVYSFKIQAQQFDDLSVWYVKDTEQSPPTEVIVEKAAGVP